MRTRIRVLCVVDSLDVGGTREIVLSQLYSLDPDRFDPGLLTLAGDLENASELLPTHVTPVAALYRRDYAYGALDYVSDGFLLRAARRFGGEVLSAVDHFDPQVLHFHTHPRDLGLGILAARRAPRALVFTDHSVRIRSTDYSSRARFLLRASYRRLYRHFNTISVGRVVARLNREAGLLDPRREHLVLENEVDLNRFRPPSAPRSDRPLEIIHVGRIHSGKGLDTLIRAFAGVDLDQPAQLTLVGPDGMDGEMQRLAAERVNPPLQVQFLGARTDVPALLQKASIGVLPTQREGLPVALLEMMASGLPVVASDIPEVAEIVTRGVDCLLVPVDDAYALAGALRRLLVDRELRDRLGKAARISAESRMHADSSARLAHFYERVALRG
jgi:glycosyltransferase involved in cell wall biosynthesis